MWISALVNSLIRVVIRQTSSCCSLKGSYHVGKTFDMLKLTVWWFQIIFGLFRIPSLTPLNSQKNYFFLVRNSTQMALTAPVFPLNWCQWLQNTDQICVNDSKIMIKLMSTTPKSVQNWWDSSCNFTIWHEWAWSCCQWSSGWWSKFGLAIKLFL